MDPIIIKQITPILIFIVWACFVFQNQRKPVALAGLFFASYAGCSSNYVFFYRELHQVIGALLIVLFVLKIVRTRKILRINYIFIIFLIMILISLINMPFDKDAKTHLINFLAGACVVNYLFSTFRTAADIKNVLNFYGVLSVVLAAAGLLMFIFNHDARIMVTFSNPNYYGLFLGIGFCVVWVNWVKLKRILALVLILIALFVSDSRASLVFPILQVLYSIYQTGDLRKVFRITMTAMVAGVLVFYFVNTRLTNKTTGGSDAERIIFARIAFQMAKEHPLSGIGWGRFISEFGNYSSYSAQITTSDGIVDLSDQDRRVTHNDFLRILSELGWIAFIAAIGISLYGLSILIKTSGFGLEYLLPVWLGLILFSNFHNNMNGPFFWFFFVLPFFIKARQNDSGITVGPVGGWRRLRVARQYI